MSIFFRLFAIVVLVGASAGCKAASSTPPLRWGGDAEGGAPYVEADPRNPDQVVGFDVEIAGLVAAALGRAPEFVQATFPDLDPSLARGDFDIVSAAFQARQQTVGFSIGNDVDLKLAPDAAALGSASMPATAPGATGAATPGSAAKKGPKAEPYKLLSAVSSANYNFARDTREWSPITSTFSLYLTKDVALTLNTTHALYDDFTPGRTDVLVSPILTAYSFGWRKGV